MKTTKNLSLMRRIGIGVALAVAGAGISGCQDNSASLEMKRLEEAEIACRPAVFRYVCAERSQGGGKIYTPSQYKEMLIIDDDGDETPDFITEKGNPRISWIRPGYEPSGIRNSEFKVVPGYTETMPAKMEELVKREFSVDRELSADVAYHSFNP